MAKRIQAQEPLYGEGHVVTPDELHRSCRDNLSYVFGQLAGEPTVGIEVPRATGIRRAETGVPLSAVLQAFRIGGRLVRELLIEHADEDTQDTLLRSATESPAPTVRDRTASCGRLYSWPARLQAR